MSIQRLKNAIAYHGAECEKSLSCADFAEHEPAYGTSGAKMAAGFRKLAAYNSEIAFGQAKLLAQAQGGAA